MFHRLDHIGVAVTDLNAETARYERVFGWKVHSRETVPSQGVELVFLSLQNTMIELLAPTRDESPLAKFLAKRGPGLHHVCYEVADIRAELVRLAAAGTRLIDTAPRPGANGTEIAFLHPASCGGILTELCQYVTTSSHGAR